MKKFMISLVAICATIFFVSCGGSSDSKEPTTEEPTTEEPTTEEPTTEEPTTEEPTTEEPTTEEPTTEEPTTEEPTTEEPTTEEPTDPTDENPLYAKFKGRWAAEIILHSTSNADAAKDVPSITTRYVLVDFSVNNKGQLDMDKVDNRLCRTDNRTGKKGGLGLTKANVLFNEPYKFNTHFHHWKPYDIAGQEDMPYVEVAQNGEEITFKLNKDWELRGANMENPATEPMVKTTDDGGQGENDPRIDDTDKDGAKAFTIGFNGTVTGKIYYVQRLSHIFTGKLIEDGDSKKNEGNVEWTDEQYTHPDTQNEFLKGQKTTITDTTKSIFQFIKVADDMDCDALLNQLDTFDLVDPNAGDAVGKQ